MNSIGNNIPLQFLKQKILGIRSALFFGNNSSNVKMPASIITVLRIDDEGCLWFFINRQFNGAGFGKEFPARLDFFRRKIDYFLRVTGRAVAVNANEIAMDEWADISAEIKNNVLNELVLMKVKMLSAEYFDNSPSERAYWFGSTLHKIQQWLFAHKLGYKPFSLRHKPAQEEQYAWNRA